MILPTPPSRVASVTDLAAMVRPVDTYSPKYSAATVAYTDGSLSPHTDASPGEQLGSGVWSPALGSGDDAFRCVRTPDLGYDGTVNLAELAALTWALQHLSDVSVLATDSQTSMWQLWGYLRRPWAYWSHPLRALLVAAADALLNRLGNGISTSFVKVPAHAGVVGNECADWAAGRAAAHPEAAIPMDVEIHHPPFRVATSDGEENLVTPLRNLTKALSAALRPRYGMGKANIDSVYYRSYRDVQTTTHRSSFHFKTSPHATWAIRKYTIRYWGGGLYNQKRAHMIGRAANSNCPLCGMPDGQNHMLGQCTNAVLAGMRTNRHDHLARIVLAEVLKGALGGTVEQSHIGHGEPLDSDELDTVPSMPPLPPRPDGINWPWPDFMLAIQSTTGTGYDKVVIVEVKTGHDTTVQNKLPGIHEHYREFAAAVGQHYGCHVDVAAVILGVGGRIPLHTHQVMLASLGLSRRAADRTCRALNVAAATWLYRMVKARRKAEREPD